MEPLLHILDLGNSMLFRQALTAKLGVHMVVRRLAEPCANLVPGPWGWHKVQWHKVLGTRSERVMLLSSRLGVRRVVF